MLGAQQDICGATGYAARDGMLTAFWMLGANIIGEFNLAGTLSTVAAMPNLPQHAQVTQHIRIFFRLPCVAQTLVEHSGSNMWWILHI
jgi:hypothetical protein